MKDALFINKTNKITVIKDFNPVSLNFKIGFSKGCKNILWNKIFLNGHGSSTGPYDRISTLPGFFCLLTHIHANWDIEYRYFIYF